MLGLGIDTGGTCTDAVIYDLDSRQILSHTKTRTTHADLTQCILQVMKDLPQDLLHKADFIALSTTLATNACVEGKGGRAKLVFIGLEPEEASRQAASYGLPPMEEIYCLPAHIPLDTAQITEPDWTQFRADLSVQFQNYDSVAITQLNARQNNGAFEKKAKEIIMEELGLPCITGYELFQEYNIYRRGASALLNARLIPVIQEFLSAIRTSLDQMDLNRPIVIVRSDGTMMSEAYACERPIETLLCGPAASIMGAMELCSEPNQVIIDMGGTTSDIALVKDGIPVRVTNGIQIGSWKTFVHGMFVDTFGLGGDSTICRDNNGVLSLDTVRSIPLCMLASIYPQVTEKIHKLNTDEVKHSKNLFEFYVLLKDISHSPLYTDREKQFCKALKDGPLLIREAAASIREDIYCFDIHRLESEGVVMKSALTPTDIMHIKGDFKGYDSTASQEAVSFLARNLKLTESDLCDQVYRMIRKKIFMNVLRILMKDSHPQQKDSLMEKLEFLYESAYQNACQEQTAFFSPDFKLNAVLVGIGAPVHVFLPEAAKMLGVKCYIPEFAPVANALGAVVGNISAEATIEIKQISSIGNADQYYFTGRPEYGFYDTLEEAEKAARQAAKQDASEKALRQGAADQLTVTFSSHEHSAMTNFGKMFLSYDVTASVIGHMQFSDSV
ncbi:N-methylhydantoinase A/acetone carboxylase%2C beta subunit [uncultured Roseburia sp.]|uniref:Hydantoinase/oxoprolinase family protein n=1 Tax=Brotonthovivens ammoniilytica TaxID=2981725 RepID=A0ABT2TMY1_9FIRM|nr:hydantoinase/oxoprolinase family protein [Brotonthovivens ammoniilytica]MCU6763151.1 hydantoinase/oxoprolinase family protein [Brotonthovivens ammoniilytica]SCJ04914.1 N-methylhydantoinase A/acetone carboxylase%2C beta subunit [uncultured Roseburia sp.]